MLLLWGFYLRGKFSYFKEIPIFNKTVSFKAVPETDLRFAVGQILSPNPETPAIAAEMELMTSHGFRIVHLPKPSYVVSALFPFRTTLSIYIAIFRVYPKLRQYISQRNLCAYPAIEIYRDDFIEFIMPLSRQDEFFVQEFQVSFESNNLMCEE